MKLLKYFTARHIKTGMTTDFYFSSLKEAKLHNKYFVNWRELSIYGNSRLFEMINKMLEIKEIQKRIDWFLTNKR